MSICGKRSVLEEELCDGRGQSLRSKSYKIKRRKPHKKPGFLWGLLSTCMAYASKIVLLDKAGLVLLRIPAE